LEECIRGRIDKRRAEIKAERRLHRVSARPRTKTTAAKSPKQTAKTTAKAPGGKCSVGDLIDIPRHIISPVDCVVYNNNMFKNLVWLFGFGFCYVTALMPSESSICTYQYALSGLGWIERLSF